ncbi:MAG: CRISPR-associated protein Cas6, partial [Hydrogenophilus thermoluteolus]
MGERDYAPGKTLAFHIVLAGQSLEQLALVIRAYILAFRRGVGRGDGTAELSRVIHCGKDETIVLDGPVGKILDHSPAITEPKTLGRSATLRFVTPLRLQTNGRRATVEELTARKLLMALVRRIALLCEFHGAGPLPLDFTQLARQAEAIESHKTLRWQDWTRYSSRQR